METTKTRPTVNEMTNDCRWAVIYKPSSKSNYDRGLAPEFYKEHYEAVKRCQKIEEEGQFIGKIKYIGSNHNNINLN